MTCQTQQTLTALVGEAGALSLMQRFGGTDCYVPRVKSLTQDHVLVELLGIKAAKNLCRYYDGISVAIPLGTATQKLVRDELIVELHCKGKTNKEIAKKLGMTSRSVRGILSKWRQNNNQLPQKPKKDDRQLSLF